MSGLTPGQVIMAARFNSLLEEFSCIEPKMIELVGEKLGLLPTEAHAMAQALADKKHYDYVKRHIYKPGLSPPKEDLH